MQKIFIRPEYKEAEECVLAAFCSEMRYHALLVIGQPGIGLSIFCLAVKGSHRFSSGKSVFLLRILLRRLLLKLPTVLQFRPNHALLFYEGGVREFANLEDDSTYSKLKPKDRLGEIWVLVCTSGDLEDLEEPAPIFTNHAFFVVHAASPGSEHHEWTHYVRTQRFYMKPWSFSEVLQA